MAVITTDVLLKGHRREPVFEWLGELNNHVSFLKNAFDEVKETDEGLELVYGPSFRKRSIPYTSLRKDGEHGGRRIRIQTGGKRTTGNISYSLRTMKPSSNTLVTLHFDYEPGGVLGELLNNFLIREELVKRFTEALEQIQPLLD